MIISLRTKIWIGAVVVAIAMATTITILLNQNKRLRMEKEQVIKFDLTRQDTVKMIRNQNGILSARVEVSELTNSNLRKLREDDRLFWLTQLDIVNRRMNNVEQASRITAKLVGEFKIPLRDTTIYTNDSTVQQARFFDNKDKWMQVSGLIMPDTIEVFPFIQLEIKSAIVWQRKKFLGLRIGRKEYFGEATTDNPYATITGMEVTKVTKRK